jgi:hypothetical protein
MMRIAPALLALVWAAPLAAQGGSCRFHLDRVGGLGQQVIVGGDTNYYAGGGVRITCQGTSVSMQSDSAAFYGRRSGTIVEFIGKVKYRDSLVTMDANRGTYYRSGERWEARGNVVTENIQNGSRMVGPSLDYYRAIKGTRDTVEMVSVGRPAITYQTVDSTGTRGEPYLIVADRVRMKGNDRIWGGGQVTIDRSDFKARGDSLRLDTGAGNDGALIGRPRVEGTGKDSFTLTGKRIDLKLDHQELSYVTAVDSGHAVTKDMDLTADTIGLDIAARELVQTVAWGDSIRPLAVATDYEIRADSLAIDTPGQRLKETRSFGKAWVGGKIDVETNERDWMSGDTVTARFAQYDSAGAVKTAVASIEASGTAKSYYRIASTKKGETRPSINYSRGDRIAVQMKSTGNRGVERVDIRGNVDGIQLEPAATKADTTKADSSAAGNQT